MTAVQEPNRRGKEGSRQTILIVDADAATMTEMKALFDERAEILCTSDYADALSLIRTGTPEVIVVDVPDPVAAILEPLKDLFEIASERSMSVIALAATRQVAAIVHAMSKGAVECMLKPVPIDKLYASTRATLERRRLVVLLGDDDVIVRELLSNRFKAQGFSVLSANDGAQLLQLAGRHRPSIIVLDRVMPGLEGTVVLQMLKANPDTHEIPVIMLTSKRKANEITEGRRAGAADYIVKPFAPDLVVARCMRELGLSFKSQSAAAQSAKA